MNFKPMQQCDLTKTDATTIVAYRNNVMVSTDIINSDYPFNIATEARLFVARKSTELILNKIFGVHHDK